MITNADSEKAWRDLLRDSFDFVQARGGLFALDLEYYTERKGNPSCWYRLLWTNRLAAETRSGRLVVGEGDTLRIGPASDTTDAVAEALEELSSLRGRRRGITKGIAA